MPPVLQNLQIALATIHQLRKKFLITPADEENFLIN